MKGEAVIMIGKGIDLVSYPCPCGVVVAVNKAALLGFRVIYLRFMTVPE
jgi:hypothetical protein